MSREERWGDKPFYPGDIVVDRDDPSGEGIVINLPDKKAHEWYVPGRGNLAADNPEYSEDDDVAIIIFRKMLDAKFPYYSGVKPLFLSDLHERGINYYAFPASRLQKVGKIEPYEIPTSKILPSPYHSRTFDVDEELRLVAELDRQDGLPRPALLRVVDEDRFTILNGHKRLWAAHVLGYDSVKARCMYVDDFTAAQIFAGRHLDDDPDENDHSDPAREAAIGALRDEWGEKAARITGVPAQEQG